MPNERLLLLYDILVHGSCVMQETQYEWKIYDFDK